MHHTLGPLHAFRVGESLVIAQRPPASGQHLARIVETANAAENASRLVACYNACEGINPDAIPDLLAACRLMLDAVNEHHKDGSILWVSPGETAWELLTDVIAKATGTNPANIP